MQLHPVSQQLLHPVAGSSALHAIAADWVARQAAHRNQVHKLGSRLLDAADLTPPTIQTVKDLAAIDKMMRQNLGLQNTSEGATVNVLFECGSGAFCVEAEGESGDTCDYSSFATGGSVVSLQNEASAETQEFIEL